MKEHKLGKRGKPEFDVEFHPAAEKEFFALPQQAQARFERAIDDLGIDPWARQDTRA